ncbi:spore gernimation protein GerA [Bacillus sp. SA1-12]|uniref:spore germination protein n=1 Tax=Bacillus sp. SA1-12 TaxID=1455638 RepID=UPI000627066E|nr:spore germination protein [Bacillus sp. SA1-12]KKI89432.1 spore gernimation protein GerA [Bacillus sp. SA1-12]
MNPMADEIQAVLKANDDFIYKRDYLADTAVILLGFKTLVDFTKTMTILQKQSESFFLQGKTSEDLWCLLGEFIDGDVKSAISAIYEGKLIIVIENIDRYLIMEPVSKMISRSIDLPSNENVIQGPLNSFTEDINVNIGIIRKQVNSDTLSVLTYSTGQIQKKKLSLLYIDGQADHGLVDNIKRHIKKNIIMDVSDLQGLSKMMEFPSWDAVSKFNPTELPSHASRLLKKGRVILFVDQMPFALILPGMLWDMFAMENDRNFPLTIMIAIRAVRVIGVLVTLVFPGLYVALVAVNPEILQIKLALSVAQSREGVPYPAIVEMMIMLIILELILEASVRLPKTIGPTITMVGGIILGQAAVEAKLVSNLLIIILAATTIANSTIVGFQNSISIRLFKYAIVILSAIFGVLGLVTGLVFVSAYLASLNTYGKSYLDVTNKRNETNNG